VIALDRVKLVQPSEFHGVELLTARPCRRLRETTTRRSTARRAGNPVGRGSFGYREGVKLTGKRKAGGFLATRDGGFAPEVSLRVLRARDSFRALRPEIANGSNLDPSRAWWRTSANAPSTRRS